MGVFAECTLLRNKKTRCFFIPHKLYRHYFTLFKLYLQQIEKIFNILAMDLGNFWNYRQIFRRGKAQVNQENPMFMVSFVVKIFAVLWGYFVVKILAVLRGYFVVKIFAVFCGVFCGQNLCCFLRGILWSKILVCFAGNFMVKNLHYFYRAV